VRVTAPTAAKSQGPNISASVAQLAVGTGKDRGKDTKLAACGSLRHFAFIPDFIILYGINGGMAVIRSRKRASPEVFYFEEVYKDGGREFGQKPFARQSFAVSRSSSICDG
jgi:hypothetical protein